MVLVYQIEMTRKLR